MKIDCRDYEVEKQLKQLQDLYASGDLTNLELESHVNQLLKAGVIRLSHNDADPFSSIFGPKKVSNPLSNKGKSYADRVEGPDGWGQHVPVTRSDDDLDDLFLSPF